MQNEKPTTDTPIEGTAIKPDLATIKLSRHLAEAIMSSDVVILIGSSENNDMAITVKQVYASGLADPEHVLSHAYAYTINQMHNDILRHVRGEPTDGDRYRAIRDFHVIAATDPERFEKVSTMLQKFEAENPSAGEHPTAAEAERSADFLVLAMFETMPDNLPGGVEDEEAPRLVQ